MIALRALALFDNMILNRLPVSADISESSYEVAKEGIVNPTLYVAVEDIKYAEKLRVPYAVDVRLLKGTWFVMGLNGGRFSPGVY
jgi:hypothetical protein